MTTNPYESPHGQATPPLQKASLLKSVNRVITALGILLLFGFCVLSLGRFPFGRGGARESARRMSCRNNLRNIAIALQNYESTYHAFPPAYTVDVDGKPLHSWRTLILPYLEQQALYERIDLTKPWDDPANKVARETVVKIYLCPSSTAEAMQTTYLGITAKGGLFQPSPRPRTDVKDLPANTLTVIEVADEQAVPWMSPEDASDEVLAKSQAAGGSSHPNGSMAVFADGHTSFLPANLESAVLAALISIAGNDDDLAKAAN